MSRNSPKECWLKTLFQSAIAARNEMNPNDRLAASHQRDQDGGTVGESYFRAERLRFFMLLGIFLVLLSSVIKDPFDIRL